MCRQVSSNHRDDTERGTAMFALVMSRKLLTSCKRVLNDVFKRPQTERVHQIEQIELAYTSTQHAHTRTHTHIHAHTHSRTNIHTHTHTHTWLMVVKPTLESAGKALG